jgi:pimeloyl-ACP methyl ester carboxylesterase
MTTSVRTRASMVPAASSGPVFRVVLTSLSVGGIGAIALTLQAFAGAPEHTVTGAALLAFAAGWAALAVLSTRLTNQPQRWALIPAMVMGTTGGALVVLAPRSGTLTTAGWVWPPALFGLMSWMVLRLRRAMTSRARWLLYPVLTALALSSAGGLAETIALDHDRRAIAMPGRLFDVGGHRLHLNCTGAGSPTVVLSNGTGEISQNWARIIPAVAVTSRVCAYDRAGQGWSDDASRPQDGRAIAADLHALLHGAGEHGPYLLVGHSLGGVYSMTFAARYPNEVAGMVLLDSSSPQQFTVLPRFAHEYGTMRRLGAVLPSFARLGIGRLLGAGPFSTLSEPAARQVRAFAASSRGLENVRDETSRYRDSFKEAQALQTLDGKPLSVLTAAENAASTPGWSAAQDKMASLSTNTLHRFVGTSHEGLLATTLGAAASSDAINTAVQSVRTHRLLSNAAAR